MRFNWTNIDRQSLDQHAVLIEESCIEAAMHGSTYYTRFINTIRSGIRAAGWLYKPEFAGVLLNYSDANRKLRQRYNDGAPNN